jgi:hypothetical protein
MNKNELQRQLNKKRASMLRKMLDNKHYFTKPNPHDLPSSNLESFRRMLTKLLTKLHQYIHNRGTGSVKISVRQYEVIDNAVDKYKMWLTKDSEDPMFISNRNLQIRKLDSMLEIQKDSNSRNGDYIHKIARDMKSQLIKRKMLLTNKQKLLCNKLYNEAKGLDEEV